MQKKAWVFPVKLLVIIIIIMIGFVLLYLIYSGGLENAFDFFDTAIASSGV